MTQMSPTLDAALRTDAPLVFGAVSIGLPHYTVRLLDGAGTVTFGGATYVGCDDMYGVLSAIDDLTDGLGDSAPALSITLLPASDTASALLAAPDMQGAPVTISLGALNAQTGQVIDTLLIFAGELDVPTIHSSEEGRRLEYEVVSVFERLFEDDESARLSPGFHRSIFAGEAGLDFVTGVTEPVYWGVAGNPSAVVVTGGGGGGSYRGEAGEMVRNL